MSVDFFIIRSTIKIEVFPDKARITGPGEICNVKPFIVTLPNLNYIENDSINDLGLEVLKIIDSALFLRRYNTYTYLCTGNTRLIKST